MSSKKQEGIHQEMLPFIMENVPSIHTEKALQELGETNEVVFKSLKEMKEIAKAHRRTSDIQFVDDFLLQFLRHRKYNVEKAFRQLLNFIEFRVTHGDWFECNSRNIFDSPLKKYFSILPNRTPDGCMVFIFEFGKWDPNIFSITDIKKEWLALFYQSNRLPMTQINGYKLIYDFADTGFKHLRHITPGNIYLLYNATLNCFPGRYKEIHMLQKNMLMNTAWACIKPFLSPKLKSRMFFHANSNALVNHFPPSMLPEHLGGTLKQYKMSEMTEWMNRAYSEQHKFPLCGQPNYEKE